MERVYTEEEVAVILREATRQRDGAGAGSDGLSLTQLREIAVEIGVDPDVVTQVASRLPAAPLGALARFFGGASRQDVRLVFERAASPEELQDLAMAMSRALQHQGRTREVLGALEWTNYGEVSQIAVTVRARGERTTVQILVDRGGAALLTAVGSVGLGAFAAAITGSIVEPGLAGGLGIMGAGLASGAALARLIWMRSSRAFGERLARLTAAIRDGLDR